MKSISGGGELPEHIKTVVHETTHLLHMTTTPFGLMLYRLRGLQTRLVIDAIRSIRSRGVEVRFPLQKTFRALPKDLSHEVQQLFQAWYAIELLILVMMGEIDVWLSHILNNPYLKGVSLGGIFANVRNHLTRYETTQQDLSTFILEDGGCKYSRHSRKRRHHVGVLWKHNADAWPVPRFNRSLALVFHHRAEIVEKAFYTDEVNRVMEDGPGFRVPGVAIS